LQTCWKIKDETIAKISYLFTLLETQKAGDPESLVKMDNLEREWISLRSLLTVGLPMKLEQLQLIHQQLDQRKSSSLNQTYLECANLLFTEISDVEDKIRKFYSFLTGDLEKSEIGDLAYLKEKEMKFRESFNGWKRQIQQQSENEDVNMD
jgi:hypothetical protein